MKYILNLTLCLLIGAGFLTACDDDDDKSVAFSLDKEEISIGNNGGTEQLMISTDKKWSISTDKSWIKVTPSNGIGSAECTISVDSTVVSVNRDATIRIATEGGEQKKVSVYQLGYEKGIYLHQADTLIESSGQKKNRVLTVKVTTNLKFKVKLQNPADMQERISWITYEDKKFDLDYGDRPRTVQLTFKWENNPQEIERMVDALFVPEGSNDALTTLSIQQKAAPLITDDRAGDSLALLATTQMMNFLFETWDSSENMQYWSGVRLWEKTDKEVKENPAMLGRVRSVNFFYFDTQESIPYQVSKLKYVETLNFFSNANRSFKSVILDPSPLLNLKYLKNLEISHYGIMSLDDKFQELGKRLISLDIAGNNLEELPWWLNPNKFPELRTLKLNTMRRWDTVTNLKEPGKEDFGLNLKTDDPYGQFADLLRWSKLDTLKLNYCFLEGELLEDYGAGFDKYTEAEVKEKKLPEILIGTPKILPDTRSFHINLNFLSGKVPTWLRYHPHLSDWDPLQLVFVQENGIDSNGRNTGFSDAPTDLDYYYALYPDKKPDYLK